MQTSFCLPSFMFRLLLVDINGTSETLKDIPKCQDKYTSRTHFLHQIHFFCFSFSSPETILVLSLRYNHFRFEPLREF